MLRILSYFGAITIAQLSALLRGAGAGWGAGPPWWANRIGDQNCLRLVCEREHAVPELPSILLTWRPNGGICGECFVCRWVAEDQPQSASFFI